MDKETTGLYHKLLTGAGVIVVVLIVVALFFQRSRSAAGQTAAFHLSEAGVHYVLHLLNSGACTPSELVEQRSIVQAMPSEEESELLGEFAVTIDSISNGQVERLRVSAVGREQGSMGACQGITAELEPFSGVMGTKYRLMSWDHRETAPCGAVVEKRAFQCKGTSKP